ncbi:MAG TPA: galactokinase [Phycisphaerae bacterium]|nr:galactokinase [Phycisphaerae bacterium]HPS52820.1 galactokinase [Phycisphaerae bacterium]
MEIGELKSEFGKTFGCRPTGIAAAPGRVNLIGEHTDYNGGFVLPIAIELRTAAAWSPRDDGRIVFRSMQQQAVCEIDLCGELSPGEPRWANYPKGVLAGLMRQGIEPEGCNVLFTSSVPIGSGLSSSASLEVAAALVLMAAAEKRGEIGGIALAELCRQAEHEYAGTPCGIMDQAISVLGRKDRALLLDCRDFSTKLIPFENTDVTLLVCDTQVKHSLNDGGYAARRKCCEETAAILDVNTLRDATMPMLEDAFDAGRISETQFCRARHAVTEIARTVDAVKALQADDIKRFGRLMYGSHESLRDDYEVSCEELDIIVELAGGCDGVFGARMTGGGFGGCAIVLAEASRADAVTKCIQDGFEKKFARRCPIFATRAADGANYLE